MWGQKRSIVVLIYELSCQSVTSAKEAYKNGGKISTSIVSVNHMIFKRNVL